MRYQLFHQNKANLSDKILIVEFSGDTPEEYSGHIKQLTAENPPLAGYMFLVCNEEADDFIHNVPMCEYSERT